MFPGCRLNQSLDVDSDNIVQIAEQIIELHRHKSIPVSISPDDEDISSDSENELIRRIDDLVSKIDFDANRHAALEFESAFEIWPNCDHLRRRLVGQHLFQFLHPASPLLSLVVHHARLRLQETLPEFDTLFKDHNRAEIVLRNALTMMVHVVEPDIDMTQEHLIGKLKVLGHLHASSVGDIKWEPIGSALAYAAKIVGEAISPSSI